MNEEAGEQAQLIQTILLKHAEMYNSQDSIDLANLIDVVVNDPDNIGGWESFYLSLMATAENSFEDDFFQQLLEKANEIELDV